MSFFGFNTSGGGQNYQEALKPESYDFQETYDGLGDELDEADDALNDETFGNTEDIRKDFNFQQAMTSRGVEYEDRRQGLSYAQAASHAATNDEEFMQDLWGTSNTPGQSRPKPAEPVVNDPQQKKVLSLEEIEAQLTSIDQQQMQSQAQQQFVAPGMIPSAQYGGYVMPPSQFLPPQVPYGQFPGPALSAALPNNVQGNISGFSGAAPGSAPGGVPGMFPNGVQPPPGNINPNTTVNNQPVVPQGLPQEQQMPIQVPLGAQKSQPAPETLGNVPINAQASRKVDLSQFPVLGSKDAGSVQVQHQGHQGQQPQEQGHPQQGYPHIPKGHYHSHPPHRGPGGPQSHPPNVELTEEQQAKLAKRHEKVSRIMGCSGIMNPKDKDFVTRFQLSQIVTDDPYNEDFYAQVFKVIHPKANTNPLLEHSQQNNSIAQAYLDQSGHRLGGRYKRADVALQRMQQQVQKAVTVAKERPKLTQYAREGALGKISFGNGKKPRQQLEIISKAAQKELEKQNAGNDSGSTKDDASSENSLKKYSKKDIMRILENIISNLMKVESESRVSHDVNTTELWESLHVLSQPSTSGDNEEEVNPFIQCLNHNKALKILLRLFKFLTREQILTIVTLLMSNLENLTVIKYGSYTIYEDKKVPEHVSKLVGAYSLTFSKVLMNAVQEFKFNEIIGLLVILIEHNNVSFVSTTKIGLSILTTLLSRAELIRGEGSISATDLSEWSSCYDELFTSLESRISAIFPPHPDDVDDGSARENYVWQFLATLSLGGKLTHQRIIVDEVRDEIFRVMNRAKAIDNSDMVNIYKKQNLLNNLNMYLVVMGLVADENEIKELQV